MSKIKRVSAILLAVCMTASLFAGCSPKEESKPESTTSAKAESTDAKDPDPAKAGEFSLPISPELITIRALSETRADITVGNDMATYKELEKRTNIHMEFELLPIELNERNTKFNVIMASGDVPDIVQSSDGNLLNKYGMQGLFLPMQDLIEEHAPNMIEVFNNPLEGSEVPYKVEVFGEITSGDGNIYNIPIISASNAIGAVWGIRTDWLEKLNMKVPTTSDELYEVLKAFKEKDPNGNGKADEIPFGAGAGGKTPTILPIVNAFDGHMDLYVDSATDTIKYGPIEENYKQGLTFLNKLYTEGLLEEDYLTQTRDQWMARAGGNMQGLQFVWPGSGFGATNVELQKLSTDYHFEPIEPFKSPSGKQYKDTKQSGRAVGSRTAVGAKTKYPVEITKYLDYCFSPEGDLLVNFGIEGEDYTMVNGEPIYTDSILKNPDGIDPETARIRRGMIWQMLPYQTRWPGHYQSMSVTAPWTVMAWDTYKTAGLVEAPFPTLALSEADLSTRLSIEAEINTYRDPMIDKFIMGIEPLTKFDEFVNGIKKAGVEDLLKMLNTSYEQYKANLK